MTHNVLKRVADGKLPMQFALRTDIGFLHDLRNAGYLRVTFGPFVLGQSRSATVTEITPLGRAVVRYLGV